MIFFLMVLMATPQVVTPPAPAGKEKPFFRAQHSPTCKLRREARAGKSPDPELMLLSQRLWVRGYVSAFNVLGPDSRGDVMGSTSEDAVDAFLDAHCQRFPSDLLADAMRPLTNSLLKRQPPNPAGAGGTPATRTARIALTVSCEKWLGSRDNNLVRLAYEIALGGYVTAYNLYGPDPSGDLIGTEDDAFATEWIDGWCRDNKPALLVSAVGPLADHLAAERAAGRLPPGGQRPQDVLSAGAKRIR